MGEPRHSFGPFVLHPGRELLRDGRAVTIGHRALQLLEAMLEADGGVVSKAELMDKVWPGMIVEDGNITVQIAALRKELGTRPDGQDWIVTVPRVGYRLTRDVPASTESIPGDGGKPRLAVMPFANLSGGESQDYFADGVVEDLITAFSRFKSFSVISRNSSFVYKGRAADVRQVGRDLGVRYLLEGSVRLAGERLRVTAQLVDAVTATHHWASSFDGELSQIFEFQDRITETVVGLVEPEIRRAEVERTRRRWPESPKAYDHFLRALPHFYNNDPAGYVTALEHLEQAIALEPDYALALAYASWSLARRVTVSLKALSPQEADHGLELARAALRFGQDDPVVLAICGHSLLAAGMKAEALATVRRGLKANPNNAVVLLLGGTCNLLAGDLDEGEACCRRAHQLSPGDAHSFEILTGLGFAHFFRGDYSAAVEWLEQSRATLVDWPPAYWMLAASHAHLDQPEAAQEALQRLLEIAPHTRIASLQHIAARSDERFGRLMEGLRKAGLS